VVGVRNVAIIDAGPEGPRHVQALMDTVRDAESVQLVLTHGHRDHAPAAFSLASELGVDVWGPEGLEGVRRPLRHGDVVTTDEGDLVAIDTPGHARHHLAFHWPTRRALFVGDLLLGRGATTWVGEYPGCVADYLTSLDRVRALDVGVLYPAHGPALEDPTEAIDRYESHRRDRIREVAEALRANPEAGEDQLVDLVYGGGIPGAVREAAVRSIRALMEHVAAHPGMG
jgi:glyoxylase-like metal-dependent hydrolase (beta-lactamase superfamily II)